MTSSPVIVIPARWASTRFPGKALADLCGMSVLQRVYQQCSSVIASDSVIVATDDERIERAAHEFGARVMMTSPDHLTGTDRVAEVARHINAPWYVNVQGDEPFVSTIALRAMLNATKTANNVGAINAMARITTDDAFASRSVPKVVCRPDGKLLYISRSPIPCGKQPVLRHAHRQVGIYAFMPHVLAEFGAIKTKTPLEDVEDIEILRLLELGFDVQMIDVPVPGIAIDTPEDLAAAQAWFADRHAG